MKKLKKCWIRPSHLAQTTPPPKKKEKEKKKGPNIQAEPMSVSVYSSQTWNTWQADTAM